MMPDSMSSPLAIQDGSDMPAGVLCGYRAIHTRRGGTRAGRTAQAAERARQGSASVFARTSTICPAGRRSGVVPCAAQSRPPVSRPHGARPRQPRRRESTSRDRTAAGAQRARQPLPDEEARTALAGLGQEMRAAGLPRGCRIEEGKTPISADCAGLGRGEAAHVLDGGGGGRAGGRAGPRAEGRPPAAGGGCRSHSTCVPYAGAADTGAGAGRGGRACGAGGRTGVACHDRAESGRGRGGRACGGEGQRVRRGGRPAGGEGRPAGGGAGAAAEPRSRPRAAAAPRSKGS